MNIQENKKDYETPSIHVISLNAADIITNSPNDGSAGDGAYDDQI